MPVKNPKVSIIVPIYNVESYLKKCITSVLTQTFTNFECILVDDCSSDGCSGICDEYEKQDSRILVIHKGNNEGLSYARKTGFEHSCGEYILNIDSDDFIEKNMIEKLVTNAVSENCDIVYCSYYHHGKSGDPFIKKVPIFTADTIMNIKNTIFDYNSQGGIIWNKLIKRNIYEKIDFPKVSCAEDRYISIQLLSFAEKIGYVDLPLYHWVFHQSSLTNEPKKNYLRFKERYENHQATVTFLTKRFGGNLSLFEPELSKRLKWIKGTKPGNPGKKIKQLIKIVLHGFLAGCSKKAQK